MKISDATGTLDLAQKASGCDGGRVLHKPWLLGDNGPSYVSAELAGVKALAAISSTLVPLPKVQQQLFKSLIRAKTARSCIYTLSSKRHYLEAFEQFKSKPNDYPISLRGARVAPRARPK